MIFTRDVLFTVTIGSNCFPLSGHLEGDAMAEATITLDQSVLLLELFRKSEADHNRVQALIVGGYLSGLLRVEKLPDPQQFRHFLQDQSSLQSLASETSQMLGSRLGISDVIPVPVYIRVGATVKKLVEQGGYHEVDPEIRDWSKPIVHYGPQVFYLVCFQEVVSSAYVKKKAEGSTGFQLALLPDLLAVGAHDCCKNFAPVICLDSLRSQEGEVCASCIEIRERRRCLRLCSSENWPAQSYFLFAAT